MKRIGFTILSLVFSSSVALTAAWAGIDYSRYNDSFKAQKAEASQESTSKGHGHQHKSKYIRDEQQGQKILPPASDKKVEPGQKYQRPDWAK